MILPILSKWRGLHTLEEQLGLFEAIWQPVIWYLERITESDATSKIYFVTTGIQDPLVLYWLCGWLGGGSVYF